MCEMERVPVCHHFSTFPDLSSPLVGFLAGQPGSGIPARLLVTEAPSCAVFSVSPMMPRDPVWWRMLSVLPTLRLPPLCRPATCTNVQSIVSPAGAQ